MDLNLIKKLVKIVDSSEITDLEIEEEWFQNKNCKKNQGHSGHISSTINECASDSSS